MPSAKSAKFCGFRCCPNVNYIAGLAFGNNEVLDSAKIGILIASVLAGTMGWVLSRAARSGDKA